MSIHPTAIIDHTCEISPEADIGPYCTVGPHTIIGAGSVLDSHTCVQGWTTIGKRCHFYHHCSLGTDPQDLKYKGEPTTLVIGNENVFREFVSLNRGTLGGGGQSYILWTWVID